MATPDLIKKVGEELRDTNKPMKARFRSLFTLRNVLDDLSVSEIGKCFKDSSALLKHELAYCLGQMQMSSAIPILSEVLSNKDEHPMVRHEAAEALGAIGTPTCFDILQNFKNDNAIEVAETVELALQRIQESSCRLSDPKLRYNSVDPAFPYEDDEQDVEKLQAILMDENNTLYERYQALFSLREMNSTASNLAITKGFEGSSALFRHEIAFVLGQIQDPVTVDALEKVLKDSKENEMVRHECAEAIGAIGTAKCEQILRPYLTDPSDVVRESCEVALDICDYEINNHFQYADGVKETSS